MVLHLPHVEGGFGVDDLPDSSSWSSPPLLLLRDIHSNLISQYDSKEVCAPSQSQGNVGSSTA